MIVFILTPSLVHTTCFRFVSHRIIPHTGGGEDRHQTTDTADFIAAVCLPSRVSRLSSRVSRLPSLISCLVSLVSRLTSLVSRLSSPVSRLSSRASRLLSLVSRLSSPVSRLSSPVSRLSSRVSCLLSLVSCLSSMTADHRLPNLSSAACCKMGGGQQYNLCRLCQKWRGIALFFLSL